MRVGTALREAATNIASGTARVALHSVILGAVIALLGGADLAAVGYLSQEAERFRLSGGSTLVYRMKSTINGGACDNLRHLDGVSASGAVRQRSTGMTPAALPAQQVPAFDISPGFAGFSSVGYPQARSGVLVSEDVATTLGVSVGHDLALHEGRSRVGGVFAYPSDGRLPGYGYSIFAPTDSRAAFDECWVETWPVSDELISALPALLMPGASPGIGDPGPQLLQLNPSHGTHFEGKARFDDRLTRFAPAVAAVVTLGLGFAATMRRRLELAAARHAGVPPGAQTLQQSAETLAWAAGGCLLALPVLAVVLLGQGAPEPLALAASAAKVMVSAGPAAVLGAIAATLSIRENHLFRYFKAR